MANSRPDYKRYTYVYHPSVQHKERWIKLATKAHTSLSKFIIATVDGVLDEKEEFQPRQEMVRNMEELRKENKALRDDLSHKNIVLDRYETELKRYRSQAFLEEDYQGMRRYSREIVDLLKTEGFIDSYRLLENLDIDPKESDLVKAVSKQLEELEGYGMIKAETRGWRWIG